jgi:hypothetical protein
MTTAAERSAELLRKLDESRQQRDDLRHSPTCERPGVAVERGFSITLTRCLGCGAVRTVRNITNRKKD